MSADERLLLRLRGDWYEEDFCWPAVDAMAEAADVIDRLRAEAAALRALLEQAKQLLAECRDDYEHVVYEDGAGPMIDNIDAFLSAAKGE